MKEKFANIARRVLRYNFEDGTTELMLGLIFFWVGLSFKPLPEPEIPADGIAIIGFVLTLFLIGWMKQRYVYPRTGYVETAKFSGNIKRTLSLLLRIFLGFILGGVIALLVISPVLLFGRSDGSGISWVILTLGLAFSLFFVYLGIRLGFPRLIVVALISAGLAILCSPLVFGIHRYIYSSAKFPYWVIDSIQFFLPAYFLFMGLVLVVSGSLAFVCYLHRNPLQTEPSNEQ
jgi:hypothetical protein